MNKKVYRKGKLMTETSSLVSDKEINNLFNKKVDIVESKPKKKRFFGM